KRLVAFSSVSHMGFVTLGIAAGVYGFTVSGRGAVLGFSGAIFQMFAHGLVSAALFMVAGSLGHKIGTRNISELGGIAKRAPRMATFMMISFMASLGLPGLGGASARVSPRLAWRGPAVRVGASGGRVVPRQMAAARGGTGGRPRRGAGCVGTRRGAPRGPRVLVACGADPAGPPAGPRRRG